MSAAKLIIYGYGFGTFAVMIYIIIQGERARRKRDARHSFEHHGISRCENCFESEYRG